MIVDMQEGGDERVAVALQHLDRDAAGINRAPCGAQPVGHILDDVRRGQHGPISFAVSRCGQRLGPTTIPVTAQLKPIVEEGPIAGMWWKSLMRKERGPAATHS